MDQETETTLLILRECFVYKIPTRTTSSGHKAADWNVDTYLWSGRCKVVARGEVCCIKLEDPNTGDLFATCPVTPGSVEPVTDSSRYFVLRIDDGTGRHAFIGMGFTERNQAFDFNAALSDHQKYVKQQKEAEQNLKKLENAPQLNLGLQEGQKIRLDIKIKTNAPKKERSEGTGTGLLSPPPSSSGGLRKLAPPPSSSNPNPKSTSTNMNDLFGMSNTPPPKQPTTNMNDLFGMSNTPPPKQPTNSFGQNDFLSSPVKTTPSMQNDPFGSLSTPTPTPKSDQSNPNWNPFG